MGWVRIILISVLVISAGSVWMPNDSSAPEPIQKASNGIEDVVTGAIDSTAKLLENASDEDDSTEYGDDRSSGTPGVDKTSNKIEEQINQYRSRRNLRSLRTNDEISQAAQSHANDMAEHNYISHESRGGQSIRGRYPCQGAGENIYQTWVNKQVLRDSGEMVYIDSASEIASAVISGWDSSQGHRRNMQDPKWLVMGVGVAISDSGKVYVVAGFCR